MPEPVLTLLYLYSFDRARLPAPAGVRDSVVRDACPLWHNHASWSVGTAHVIVWTILANMTQQCADVIFTDQGTTVILENTLLASIDNDTFLF